MKYNLSNKYSKTEFEIDLFESLKKELTNLVCIDVYTMVSENTNISFVYKDLLSIDNEISPSYSRQTLRINRNLNLISNNTFGNFDIIQNCINNLK